MKKRLVKGLACLLAATMMFGGAMTVLADEGSTNGAGNVEGSVNKNVVSIVLPVVAEDGDTTFNFTLDPEGLIAETSGERYADKTFEEGATVYFPVTKDGTNVTVDYASSSNKLTVTNKGTTKLDVTLTAELTGYDGITLTADKTFVDDTNASLYLALVDGNNEVAIAEDGTATMNAEMEAVSADEYEVQWNETDGKYEYVLKDEANATFVTYDFWMTGACNAAGDWSELTAVAPAIAVTWTVVEHVEVTDVAPSIVTAEADLVADTPIEIEVDFGMGTLAATDITSITFINPADVVTTLADDKYTFADNTITITADCVNGQIMGLTNNKLTSREFTVTFDNGATAVFTLNLPTT